MDFNTFKTEYKDGNLQITGDVSYSMREVLEDNFRLINGIFKTSNYADGTKKLFYNFVLAFSNMIYRSTDIDTKDINIRSTNGKHIEIVALLKGALKAYLKDSKFAQKLNDFRRDLIREGHLIVKDVEGEVKKVNLLNVIIPPHVASLQDSGLIEATYLTWEEMQVFKDSPKWKEIKEVWKEMQAQGEVYFTVYEHWKIDEFEDEKGKKVEDKGCVFYLDTSIIATDEVKLQSDYKPDIEIDRIISYKKVKGKRVYPYKEAKFVEISGRYWGLGVAELISALQEDYNEKMNFKRKFDRLQLRGILVHTKSEDRNRAKAITQEFLNNLDTGVAVEIENDEKLERLNLGSTTFDTIAMLDKLFELMRIIIGVTQQATGEHSPATTTATVGMINQQAAQTTYDVVTEVQSIFLTDLFNDFLIKDIVEDLTKKKVIQISGSERELKELDRFFITNLVYQQAQEAPIQPTEEEVKMEIERLMEEQARKGTVRFAEIKNLLLKDIEYVVDFYVNNEAFDKQTTIVNLREMARDPLYTGSRIALYNEIRDLIGLSGERYEKTKEELDLEMQQAIQQEAIKTIGMGQAPDTKVPEAQNFGQQLAIQQ